MYRRVWVPDGRAEPFFPLCPRRPCWTISPGVAAGLPPARVAAFAPRDIIHRPSLPYGSLSPAPARAVASRSFLRYPWNPLIFNIHVSFRDAGLWAGVEWLGAMPCTFEHLPSR